MAFGDSTIEVHLRHFPIPFVAITNMQLYVPAVQKHSNCCPLQPHVVCYILKESDTEKRFAVTFFPNK